MKKRYFVSAIWKEGRYYVAQCLNIDIASFGRTRAIAVKNLKEALELYLEDAPFLRITRIKRPSITLHEHTLHV